MEKIWTEVNGTPLAGVSDSGTVWNSTQELEYNNKVVLYAQARGHDSALPRWVVVFGYKVGDYYELNGRTAVRVESVAAEDKEKIREEVEKSTQGVINFW